MTRTQASETKLDNLYLKFFKYAVVAMMTLALLAVVVLIPLAGYNYFQTPVPPTPAKVAPEKAVNLDDFKKFLIEEEKRRLEQEKSGGAATTSKQAVTPPVDMLRYAEQNLLLYRCAVDFQKAAEIPLDTLSQAETDARVNKQRASIEGLANDQFTGPKWVDAMVDFACGVMKYPEIVKLKKEEKIGAVVTPAILFHARAWAGIQREKAEFNQAEANRVRGEVLAENVRVAAGKVKAAFILSLAGGAILFFLAMALYLIFAKIEDNLALIHQSIVQRTLPAPSAN